VRVVRFGRGQDRRYLRRRCHGQARAKDEAGGKNQKAHEETRPGKAAAVARIGLVVYIISDAK
jgi:hypothetical protein